MVSKVIILAAFLSANSAMAQTGNVYAWGSNYSGVLNLPATLTNVVALAGGYNHSLALKTDGTIVGWGDNTYGESMPVQGATDVVAIAAGLQNSAVLRSDGSVISWGNTSAAPADATNVSAIAAGGAYNLALKSNGIVLAWGPGLLSAPPASATNLVSVAAGFQHSLGLRRDGSVVSWGSQTAVPVSATNLIDVAAGEEFSVGLRADGTVMAWGQNTYGQTNVPSEATNILSVSAGYQHAVALREDGRIIVWGDTNYGLATIPSGLTFAAGISAGSYHNLALLGSGNVRFNRQPADQSLRAGSTGWLSGSAMGAGPITYQWLLNGTNIPGANHAYLSLTNAQVSTMGSYQLVVSNSQGSITSLVASVTVTPSAPIILQQPTNQAVVAGSNVTFVLNMAGTAPLSYQWLKNGTNISGATSSVLVLPDVQTADVGSYSVIVTNELGAVTSVAASLSVVPFAVVESGLPVAYEGQVVWGDYDNDGFQDVFVTGLGQLYHNLGNGTFTNVASGLPVSSDSAWGDYDNDGFLDMAISTSDGLAIYRNLANGTFSKIATVGSNNRPVWGDYNNDGRQDLLLSGRAFQNMGNGTFAIVTPPLPAIQLGNAGWGDYNNDGRLDVLLSGISNFNLIARVYRNDGSNVFTDAQVGLPGVGNSATYWYDYDNDGRLDILLTGETAPQALTTKLFHNNGDGTFTDIHAALPVLNHAVATFGDFDADGKQDFFLAGRTTNGQGNAWLYHNNGDGSFIPMALGLTNIAYPSQAAFGDLNNDGRPDLIVSGINEFSKPVMLVYQNFIGATNSPPTVPGPMPVVVNGSSLTFQWSGATDQETPAPALSYNVRVGTTPGSGNVVSPWSMANGQRLMLKTGNAGQRLSTTVTNLGFGTYYWSVQAVDGGFATSAFAPEQVFVYAAQTLPATNVNSSQATLNGLLSANGLTSTSYFEWGTSTNYGNKTPAQNVGAGVTNGYVNASLAGLLPGTTYHYQLVISNASGNFSGGDRIFTTVDVPSIVPLAVSNVTAISVTLNAMINPKGSSSAVYFEYGLTPAYGSASVISNIAAGSIFVPVARNVSGLIGGQIYHYRVVATNIAGAAYSADLTFATTPEPEVTTLAATNIAATSATLNGMVRPNTLPTIGFFQYGLTTNYNAQTPAMDVGSGTNLITVGIPVTDLNRASTYHFRVVASNAYTVSYGADRTFVTTNDVIATFATNIGMTNATLNGLVNPLGVSNSVYFEYGLTTNLGSATPAIVLDGGTNLMPVAFTANGLASGSNYFYRVVVANSDGVRVSSVVSFQTLPLFDVVNPGLAGSINGSMSWGDYDNDGRLDMLVTDAGSTRIYRNLGGGAFTNVSTTIPGITFGTVSWGDYNNDGWPDILISGSSSSGPITRIYRNNKNGTFTEINAGLPNLGVRSAHWGDFDNDGKSDVLLVGETNSVAVTMLYRNNGDGTFSDMHANLPAFLDATVACADYDNDGRLDVLLMGRVGIMYADVYAKLCHNDGNGTFHETGIPLDGARLGFADWGDYDGDGLLDLVLGGQGTNLNYILRIYHNNGNGTFSNQTGTLPQYAPDAAIWGDYDSDGRPDLLIRGQSVYSSIVPPYSYSAVLRNNGDGTFTASQFPLPEIWSACGGWADYDGDGRLDAVISGNSRTGAILRFYHNNLSITNTAPTAPTNLAATVSSNGVVFSWDRAMDMQSGISGLSYGLRIGLTPGGGEVLSPLADNNGVRRVVGLGNAGENTQLAMNLPGGTYYWSVQAIDGSFVGSPFGVENSFVILGPLFVETLAATNLTATRATIRGEVYASGVQTTTALEWGNSTNLENEVAMPMIPLNAGTNQFSLALTNLSPGTTYYYRMVATNFLGLVRGEILEFQTAQIPGFLQAGSFSSNSNSFGLTFNGSSGFKYRVYASTNLVNWTSVGFAAEVGTNQFMFNDMVGTNYPRRFYRVLAP